MRAALLLCACAAAAHAGPAEDLLARVLPKGRAADFEVTVTADAQDSFTVKPGSAPGKVAIEGNNAVSVASGLQWYMNNVAKVQLMSWAGDNKNLPDVLPAPQPTTITRSYKWGYYQNVCTVSYTFAWYNWEQWERELDWMAMNGLNMPLAFTGQEYVWQETFKQFGLSASDLDPFFAGPGFFAWQRMGNLRGWGGPLPQAFINAQKDLQLQILRRVEELGMTPVLPAFAGHIPEALIKKYPNITWSRSQNWNNFPDQYGSVYYLEPSDPMFITVGKAYIETQRRVFNSTSIYFNADQFNEMSPASGALDYLAEAGYGMYAAMTAAEPTAVWVMQGWLFTNDPHFWTVDRSRAYLSKVPTANMLILDLYSESEPQFSRLDSFFGKPWVWSMLHNFGGSTGLSGALEVVNTQTQNASLLKGTTIAGFGLTMEGTLQNYVMYELMMENTWRKAPHPSLQQWVYDYAARRYGADRPNARAAWDLLRQSVYAMKPQQQMGVTKSIVMLRPGLNLEHGGFMATSLYYDPLMVQKAAKALLAESTALGHSEGYLYDVVDVVRQALSNELLALNAKHTAAYKARDTAQLTQTAGRMIDIIKDLDRLLATSKFFLLGTWIRDARFWGGDNSTLADYCEWNARQQVTLWGPDGQVIDYAGKEWAGLVGDYYLKRWELFFSEVAAAVAKRETFDQAAFNKKVFATVEEPWQHSTSPAFPTTPTGDTVAVATEIVKKYFR